MNIYVSILSFIMMWFCSMGMLQAVPLDLDEAIGVSQEVLWTLEEADAALESGLPKVAEGFYKDVLVEESLSEALRVGLILNLSSALIAQEKYAEASNWLSTIEENSPELLLKKSIIAYHLGYLEEAKAELDALNLEALERQDHYWYYLVSALVRFEALVDKPWYGVITDFITFDSRGSDKKVAVELLEKAKAASNNPFQKAQAESLLLRARLVDNPVGAEVLESLKGAYESAKEVEERLLFVREYAVVLKAEGQKEAAVELLEKELGNLNRFQFADREALFLLVGILEGPSSKKGGCVLRQILREKYSLSIQRSALGLLSSEEVIQNDFHTYVQYISGLIDEGHLLKEALLYARAQAYFKRENYVNAQADAEALLEQFPRTEFQYAAQCLLARIAWSLEPPHYRTAAYYLTQMRGFVDSADKRARLDQMIADCYYLNEDYEYAAKVYGEVLDNNEASVLPKGPVLFQKVLSEIVMNDLKAAEETLDNWGSHPEIDTVYRWRGEWNLITALKKENRIEVAFQRIKEKLAGEAEGVPTTELILRLMWLRAQLSIEAKEYAEAPIIADQIIDRLRSVAPDVLDSEQLELIASHTLLIKGRALLLSGDKAEGIAVLKELRAAYPYSRATIQSYLVEARHYAFENEKEAAQKQLIELVDRHPENEQAPIALYEAALNAQLQGTDAANKPALQLLERVIVEYPEHPLGYYARLKQADILRSSNNFGAAQLIYENLMQTYPEHPDRFCTELARGDCLLAQGHKEGVHYKEAETVFERLFELPNLSKNIRLEAGYKLGFCFSRENNDKRAIEVYWALISQFLINPQEKEEGDIAQAHYWIARTLFALADCLEREGAYKEAETVYKLLIKNNLPGRLLAEEKINIGLEV